MQGAMTLNWKGSVQQVLRLVYTVLFSITRAYNNCTLSSNIFIPFHEVPKVTRHVLYISVYAEVTELDLHLVLALQL